MFNMANLNLFMLGIYRFDQSNRQINSFPSDAHEARAILEGQFLSMRLHKEALGERNTVV